MLHDFAGGTDGAGGALAALVADDTGALYGTTAEGGGRGVRRGKRVAARCSGYARRWMGAARGQESVLHAFAGNDDGAYANSPLSINENGVVYARHAGGRRHGVRRLGLRHAIQP